MGVLDSSDRLLKGVAVGYPAVYDVGVALVLPESLLFFFSLCIQSVKSGLLLPRNLFLQQSQPLLEVLELADPVKRGQNFGLSRHADTPDRHVTRTVPVEDEAAAVKVFDAEDPEFRGHLAVGPSLFEVAQGKPGCFNSVIDLSALLFGQILRVMVV